MYTQFRNLLRPLVMMKPLPNRSHRPLSRRNDERRVILLHDFEISALSIKRIDHGFELFARLSKLYYGRICEISCLDLEDRSFFIGRKAKTRCFIPDHRSKRGIESLSPSCLNTFSRARGVSTSGIFYLGEKEGAANKRLSESGRSFHAIASRPRISRVSCKTRR